MESKNYFEGFYTLNRDFIIRRSFFGYSLYNINNDSASEINAIFYNVLKLFLHNSTNLSEIRNYFYQHHVDVNLDSVQTLIKNRSSYSDLLVESKEPFYTKDIYENIDRAQIYEYTPENVDFLITNKCNLTCPHCYRNSTAKDSIDTINLKRLFEIFDEMEEMRVRSLKITGGEPFLVSNLYDIVKYASNKRFHIGILTNGTITMNDRWLQLLKKKNISLGISLDGASAKTHDIIRGKGSFKKTIGNLKKFSENNIQFSLTFSVNIHNFKEIEEILLLAIELNAFKLSYNFIEESGRAIKNKKIYSTNILDINAIKDQIQNIEQTYCNQIKIVIADNHGLVSDEKDVKTIKEKKDLIICRAGFFGLAIDSSLNAYPCIYAIGGKKEYPVGSLLNNSLEQIWNDNQLDIFRGKLKIKDLPKCKNCDKQDLCNLKYCRLRPIYEGDSFYDVVPFCAKELELGLV